MNYKGKERERENAVCYETANRKSFNGENLALRNHKKVGRESGRRRSLVAPSVCLCIGSDNFTINYQKFGLAGHQELMC